MKRQGFTLVELLAVLAILGILIAFTVPVITKSLKNAEESTYKKQINSIELAAKQWGAEHDGKLPDIGSSDVITIDFNTLINENYLEEGKIINPKTEEELTGCIKISYNTEYNQYEYKYIDNNIECDQHNINNL